MQTRLCVAFIIKVSLRCAKYLCSFLGGAGARPSVSIVIDVLVFFLVIFNDTIVFSLKRFILVNLPLDSRVTPHVFISFYDLSNFLFHRC